LADAPCRKRPRVGIDDGGRCPNAPISGVNRPARPKSTVRGPPLVLLHTTYWRRSVPPSRNRLWGDRSGVEQPQAAVSLHPSHARGMGPSARPITPTEEGGSVGENPHRLPGWLTPERGVGSLPRFVLPAVPRTGFSLLRDRRPCARLWQGERSGVESGPKHDQLTGRGRQAPSALHPLLRLEFSRMR
jgi:hypothetical protein